MVQLEFLQLNMSLLLLRHIIIIIIIIIIHGDITLMLFFSYRPIVA
jgi:hypothetical protein